MDPKVEVLSGAASVSPVDISEVDPQAARAAMEKLLADQRFHASDRNRRFLRFVVEQALAGHSDRIKSYAIAVDVFGRGPDFDPAIDPIVRIEATRLRAALAQYYADPGRGETTEIRLPKGGYVPTFTRVEPAARADQAGSDVIPLTEGAGGGVAAAGAGSPDVAAHRHFRTIGILALMAVLAAGALFVRDRLVPAVSTAPVVLVSAAEAASSDPTLQQIASGFTQSLVMALSRFDGLRVVQVPSGYALSAALDKFGSSEERPHAYTLDSSIRLEDQTIRFWWTLKDARSGETIWTDIAEHSLSKGVTMPVEDEVAGKLATAIGQPQGLVSMRQIGYERVQPTEGYGCVLRSRAYYLAISEALHREVRDCLEKTVAAAPDYSDAWAMLAFVYLDEDRNKFNRRSTAEDALQRAVNSAQRAAQLAPQSETAQEALMAVFYRKGEFDTAFAAGRRALEINPHNPELQSSLGIRLFARGQWDEGAALVRQSTEDELVVPPLDRVTLVFDRYRKGDYEAAFEQAQLIGLPKYYIAPFLLAAIHGQMGNEAEAKKNVDALLAIRPDYAAEMRADWRSRHYTEALIDMLADGLKKAGLTVQ